MEQPNILFIAIDDLRPELGCYGNEMIQTPNIDKVAQNGFVFNHHYVQVPTCGASRFALLTGMRPRTRLHLTNNVMADLLATAPESKEPETFVHHFRRNGYRTVGIGKIGHSADGLVYGYEDAPSNLKELPYSWDEFLFDPGKWKTGWNAFFGYASGENRQSLKKQVKPYEKAAVDDQGYPDGLTTRLALAKLKELKNRAQPFFLGVGYFKPHLPFTAPAKYWDLYREEDLPLPAFAKIPHGISRASLHNSNEFNQYELGEEKASLDTTLSDSYTRKLIHAYYACVSYADAQVGQLINELEALGLAKNTIIVIWGDHGWHLGDLRVWGKHTISEYALRSTLVMKIPTLNSNGRQVKGIVESVDIFPTLLDLCKIPSPGRVHGESFARLLQDQARDRIETGGKAYSYFRNGISMRTDTFRITQYFRQEEPTIELYNYLEDPNETKNIASDYPAKINELLPLLQLGNTGLYANE
jgi:arylsulfatase A-like enzyme